MGGKGLTCTTRLLADPNSISLSAHFMNRGIGKPQVTEDMKGMYLVLSI